MVFFIWRKRVVPTVPKKSNFKERSDVTEFTLAKNLKSFSFKKVLTDGSRCQK